MVAWTRFHSGGSGRLLSVALIAVVQWLIPVPALAVDWQELAGADRLFTTAGLRGCFVLLDVNANRLSGHDPARAATRFIPASTFKIANTLIGLDAGAVANVDEVLPYGGKPQPFKTWEHDMSLRAAIKISNVPIFQELARRIGQVRMREGIARIGYGNGDIGSVVDRFWLQGPLKISAIEQARFLARLAQGQLPFPAAAQEQVRDIVELERGEGWILYGKTGRSTAQTPDLGWWVGWVKKGDRIYSFALNVDLPPSSDPIVRINLGKSLLHAAGVL
jgi:beta-lactamase class D